MKLYSGDILKPPPPLHPNVRFRVREVETVMQFGPWLKPLGKVQQYALQLYSQVAPGSWGWMDRSHDRKATIEQIMEWGFVLEETAKVQLELF